MPRRCKRRTLPIELIPHKLVGLGKKATLAGLEPATLRFEVLRAIHCATGPKSYGSGGIRTHAFK